MVYRGPKGISTKMLVFIAFAAPSGTETGVTRGVKTVKGILVFGK